MIQIALFLIAFSQPSGQVPSSPGAIRRLVVRRRRNGEHYTQNVASACSGPDTLLPLARDLRLSAHRLAARAKALDREPGPSHALAPAARASSPLGDFARPVPYVAR